MLRVEERYVDDVVQEVIAGAWVSIQAGRYQPAGDGIALLWCWVRGITHRQVSNHRRRAWRRREVITDEGVPDVEAHVDLELQIDAARELAALRAGAPRTGLSKGWIRAKAMARARARKAAA